MTLIDEDADAVEARLNRRLRVAGIVAILAAACGSVTAAAGTTSAPVTDQDCSMVLATGGGFSAGCDDEAAPTSAR
ncbi:hypothetical protein F4692_000526 [Nocardioides cavernae]|uniref:Uncharacterized protein n=1 Tax=Nocardioides cavernae TaxID=1921566 RepID=A0A7Y9GZX3_9ACTN|nr:hypothetical protein [Nocardioides cavernae]NYE35422.1 hypothetical protein [Nocardioides cavernae]